MFFIASFSSFISYIFCLKTFYNHHKGTINEEFIFKVHYSKCSFSPVGVDRKLTNQISEMPK